ncbi:hypothetical protein CR513_20999, partial [Mucuna pruriens]
MKDLCEASSVLGIEILRNPSQCILRLSQKNYISKVLDRFDMKDNKLGDTLIAKRDNFSLKQCPNNDLERNEMQKILYASVVRSDIAFVVRVLSRYLNDPEMQHWKAVKCTMHYFKRTKWYMFTYQKYEGLKIIRYFDSNFARCQDRKRSMSGYVYMMAGRAISSKSIKQTLIAPSTMTVEFVACFETSNHETWLRNFITVIIVI